MGADMSELIVVAGATGYLGRYLVAELRGAGHRVRAVVRSRARAEAEGPFGSPSLAGLVDEWCEGEVTHPEFARGVCDGADRVVSALGVTRQKASPWDVDYLANLRLLEGAERHGLRSFLYVNVMHVDVGTSLIMRSKAAFAQALVRSRVPHQLINPSGYFSDLGDYVRMARSGLILLPPDPGIRVAPIHGADLARFCLAHLGDASGSWDVGGPDVFTYRAIAQLAASVVPRRTRTVVVPAGAVRTGVWVASRFGERAATLAQFFAEGLTHDAVGERFGDHHLADHFRALAVPS